MKRFIVLLLAIGIALSLPGVALAQKVGAFTVVQGTVDLIPTGKAAHAAKRGEPVQVGDTVRTRKEGRAEITFDDGTIIRVARGTEMAINQFLIGDKRTDAQINLPRGKIQSVVPKKVGQLFGQQEANRFEVKTPTATCGVRGTDFFTYHQDGISGATFKEGQGYFFNNKTPDQVSTIVAGQTGTISGADGKPVVRPATKEEMSGHSKDTGAANGKSSDSGNDKNAKSEGGDKEAAGSDDGQKDKKESTTAQDDGGNKDANGNKGKSDDAPLAYTPPPPPPVDEGPKNVGPTDNRNITINIDKKITESDTTPPVINLTSAIADDDATFNISVNEATRQLTYYLDGQKTNNTTFDGLTDGTHTFSVEAKDVAGNLATQSYSWTISTTPPDVGVDPALTVDAGGSTILRLTPHSDTTTFDYVLTGESSASGTASATVEIPIYNDIYHLTTTYNGTTSGPIDFTALHYDLAGSSSNLPYWTYGSIYGETDLGDLAVASGYDWGGWRITAVHSSATIPATWLSGGTVTRGSESGYWFMKISGDGASGTSEMTYLTEYYLGHGTGTSTATYYGGVEGIIEDVAVGTVTHTPLAFGGTSWGALLAYDSSSAAVYEGLNGVNEVSYANGRLGGTVNPLSVETAVPFTTMGYLSSSIDATTPVLLYGSGHHAMGLTYGDIDGGANFYGYLVGSAYQNSIRAKSYLLYIIPEGEGYKTGYLTSGDTLITGEYHPEVNVWLGNGTYTAVPLGETTYSNVNSSLYSGGLNHFRGTTGRGSFDGAEGGTLSLLTAMGDPIRVPDQTTGIWNAGLFGTYNGTTAASWSVTTGGPWYPGDYWYYTGGGSSDGYWIGQINGNEWGDADIGGTFTGQALTLTDLYSLTGDVLGNHIRRDAAGNGDWQAAGVGTYTITPLAMAGIIESAAWSSGPEWGLSADSYYGYLDYYEDVYGLLGATENPWYQDVDHVWQTRPVEVVLMGKYYANDPIETPYLWHSVAYSHNVNNSSNTTFDNGALIGYVGGAWRNGVINGYLATIYLDPNGNAGVLVGDLDGSYYPNSGGFNSLFEASGTLTPVQLASGIAITPANFYTTLQANTNGTLAATIEGQFATGGYLGGRAMAGWYQAIPEQDWGLLMLAIDGYDGDGTGYYNPNNDTEWSATITGVAYNAMSQPNFRYEAVASGTATIGADAAYGDVDGTLAGAWVDLDRATTGVAGGKIMGTFDPANANWQAVALGVGMDTAKFLELAATEAGRTQLAALSIPNVEIGRTTLSGTNGNISVAMNDVTFFGYRSGESPNIWATGSVNGTYTDLTAAPVSLNGTGFSNVSFNPTFNATNWSATVNGSGVVADTHSVTISGNAAGTINTAAQTFTGTGSGISTPNVP